MVSLILSNLAASTSATTTSTTKTTTSSSRHHAAPLATTAAAMAIPSSSSSSSSSSPSTSSSPPHPIPLYYRIPLLTIEAIFALQGSAMLVLNPAAYLAVMSPSLAASPLSPAALAEVRILTDQVAALQFVFAVTLGLVLRCTRDVYIWRLLCAALLLSDVLHVAASLREMARAGNGIGFGVWRPEDWVNFGALAFMALARLGVVLKIGVREPEDDEARRQHQANGKVKTG